MTHFRLLTLLSALIATNISSFAQFTNDDYQKALWMTTRFYGAQRSGEGPNWVIMDHNINNNGKTRNGVDFINDSDGSYDLSGGWHDCGDHVKFGQTQFYSAYMLLVGYDAFPNGYRDNYSYDYQGYNSSNDFTWAGKKGIPNGIPDVLDEVKYATDYFIKCAKDDDTFYSQVGNGNFDHKRWVTSVHMSTLSQSFGGETRAIKKNPNDASMASFCAATLATMSRLYRSYDATYADLCLAHAKHAYNYASDHKTNAGGGTITGSFYGPDNDWKDNYICAGAELYETTGIESYKDDAWALRGDISQNYWILDFENGNDLALYSLAKLGDNSAKTKLQTTVNNYKNKENNEGVMAVGTIWGRLRYSGNAAFSIALFETLDDPNTTTVDSQLKNTVDYILGDNNNNLSFVVGFGAKSAQRPHHRNVYLDNSNENTNSLPIPTRNKEFGMMIGGTDNSSGLTDQTLNFQQTEGCIDYNAGVVGALAYIVSKNDPISGISSGADWLDQGLINVFPTTVSSSLTVSQKNVQETNLTEGILYSVEGKTIKSFIIDSSSKNINVSDLKEGMYLLELINENGQRTSTKIHKF